MPVSMSIIDILLENHNAEDALWVERVRHTGHWRYGVFFEKKERMQHFTFSDIY